LWRTLKEHRQAQVEARLKVLDYDDQGLVFADEGGKPLSQYNVYKRHFKPLLQRRWRCPDIRMV